MQNKKIVAKFGGSSMGDYNAMLRSAQVVLDENPVIVLVSATYKTTDQLVLLISKAKQGHWNECEKILFNLREKHFEICQTLKNNQIINEKLRLFFNELETLARGIFLLQECSLKAKDQVLSFGERMSSLLFTEVLLSVATDAQKEIQLFDIRTVLKTDSNFGKATPNLEKIRLLAQSCFNLSGNTLYISQGFIGSNDSNATTTLGRGGSDYSASLLAEAIDADILQIWTDVPGIATTDPKYCADAFIINEISYNEASEMAQYGAKVLHPTTLVPAMRKKIPVFVGNTFDSKHCGTWIKDKADSAPLVRAISARKDQTLLIITTPKMLNAFGFMSKIFNVFEEFRISVDCVTTSEISIAITIDNSLLEETDFIDKLRELGEVKIESGYSLISLIGNNLTKTSGVAKNLFNVIDNLNIRMMCLGASDYNFNFLVKEEDGQDIISKIHKELIGCNDENRVIR